jgi:hypothetical protein
MPASAPFRLHRSRMLFALISAAFAGQAGAAAGRVDFTTSGVTVSGRQGPARPLAKGAELDSGDVVRTNEGRAQIRFSDGSYVSLQPNTDFAINDYKFEGKNDDRGFFGLVRGAMRTVTGAVGRVNRNSYRITTPTATVGIRGTGGVIQVLNDGSTLVIGTSGIWSLTNPAGSIDIPAGVSGLAPSTPNTPPKETDAQPQTSTAPVQPTKTEFVQGDQVNPDGTAAIQPVAPKLLLSGSGYQATAFWPFSTTATSFNGGNVDALFDTSGRLTDFKDAAGTQWSMGSGTHADFGTDGILAWGRWTGTVTAGGSPATFGANQGMHYVIGTPTAVMPTTGTAAYTLAGATRPTDTSGSLAPGTFTGSLNVTFGATNTIGVNYTVAIGGVNYVVNQTGTGSGSTFSQTGSGNFASGAFAGSSGTVCTGSCSSFVQGFFAGASAERAGIGYHITDSIIGRNIIGTAAFQR